MTYLAMFSDMPPAWYIQKVRDSCKRKGYDVPIEDIVKMFTQYKPKWKGRFVYQDGENFIRG